MAALVCFARFCIGSKNWYYTSVLAKAIVPDLRFPSRHKAAPRLFKHPPFLEEGILTAAHIENPKPETGPKPYTLNPKP